MKLKQSIDYLLAKSIIAFKFKHRLIEARLTSLFFRQRVVCAWNSLPSSVVEASSVNIFKKRLDDWSQVIHYIYKLQVDVIRHGSLISHILQSAAFCE